MSKPKSPLFVSMRPTHCVDCGYPLVLNPRGVPRLRCPPCVQAYKTASKRGPVARACLTCGVTFPYRSRARYCPDHRPPARNSNGLADRTRTCPTCRRPFITRHPSRRYCSDPCKPAHLRKTNRSGKKPSTAQRGLGWHHQKRRTQLLAALQDGQPCPLCHRPMYRDQPLDLDHSTPRALGGQHGDRLTHQRCNRQAGARLGNQLRQRAPNPRGG